MNPYELITERVLESLEKGVVPWRKPWNDNGPTNAYTRRAYTGCNILILGMSPHPSKFWVGYSQAQHMGGFVKKGEKSTQIIKWNVVKKRDEDGNEVIVGMTPLTLSVFNLSQTNMDWEKLEKNCEPKLIRDAEDILNGYRDRPSINFGSNYAAYSPLKDVVYMPERDSFESPESFYNTLFHELTHSTGHETRLKRDLKNHFGSPDYSREELVAEMGACFLSNESGIMGKTFNQTVGYVNSWLDALRQDKTMFVRAATAAQKAADYILGRKNGKE